MTTVWSYPYNAASGTVGTRKTIITNIPSASHSTRTLRVSKKNPDSLIVAVGSDGNLDAGTTDKSSGRSQLRTFSISKISHSPVTYESGTVLGWGLRNSVGVTENPTTGGIVSEMLTEGRRTANLTVSSVVRRKRGRQPLPKQRRHPQHQPLRSVTPFPQSSQLQRRADIN